MEGGQKKRENGSCVLLDCPGKIILVLSSLTPWQTVIPLHPWVTGRPVNRLLGFAWLARRLNGSRKPLSVWAVVISFCDLLLLSKVELLSQPLFSKMNCILYIALDGCLKVWNL